MWVALVLYGTLFWARWRSTELIFYLFIVEQILRNKPHNFGWMETHHDPSMLKLQVSLPFLLSALQRYREPMKYELVSIVECETSIAYEKFFQRYLFSRTPSNRLTNNRFPNQPFLLRNGAGNWKSSREWVLSSGFPNFSFLSKAFGGSLVPVAECDTRDYTDRKRQNINFSSFVEYWESLASDISPHSLLKHQKDSLKLYHF